MISSVRVQIKNEIAQLFHGFADMFRCYTRQEEHSFLTDP